MKFIALMYAVMTFRGTRYNNSLTLADGAGCSFVTFEHTTVFGFRLVINLIHGSVIMTLTKNDQWR